MNKEFKFRRYESGDENKLVKLTNKIFNLNTDLEYWRWKFLSCPEGFNISVAEDLAIGEIVGQYCSQFKKGIYDSKEITLINVVDIGVAEEFRGLDFFPKALKFDLSQEYAKKENTVTISFPKIKVVDLAQKNLDIDSLLKVNVYKKKLKWFRKFFLNLENNLKVEEIEVSSLSDIEVNEFWNKKKKELSFSVVRDFNYIKWRFFDYNFGYRFYLIKKGKEVVGYFCLYEKKSLTYVIDFLVLNNFLSDGLNLLEKKVRTREIEFMVLNQDLESELIKNKYKIKQEIATLIYSNFKKKLNLIPYITYSDTDFQL